MEKMIERLYKSKYQVYAFWKAQKTKESREILMEKYQDILINLRKYEARKW